MTQTIELDRMPNMDEFIHVIYEAEKPCVCTDEMKASLKHGDEVMCAPCAARQVLNGVASLSKAA